MTQPLTALPDEDAPIREWARPLSATLTTRDTEILWGDRKASMAGLAGNIVRRVKKRMGVGK